MKNFYLLNLFAKRIGNILLIRAYVCVFISGDEGLFHRWLIGLILFDKMRFKIIKEVNSSKKRAKLWNIKTLY
jgi:hypothetical protein